MHEQKTKYGIIPFYYLMCEDNLSN